MLDEEEEVVEGVEEADVPVEVEAGGGVSEALLAELWDDEGRRRAVYMRRL